MKKPMFIALAIIALLVLAALGTIITTGSK